RTSECGIRPVQDRYTGERGTSGRGTPGMRRSGRTQPRYRTAEGVDDRYFQSETVNLLSRSYRIRAERMAVLRTSRNIRERRSLMASGRARSAAPGHAVVSWPGGGS